MARILQGQGVVGRGDGGMMSSMAPGDDKDRTEGIPQRIGRLLSLYPTRREAAEVAGISTDQLARYVTGRSAPPFQVVARLARPHGVSLDWLAHGDGDMMVNRRLGEGEEGVPVTGLMAGDGTTGWFQPRPLSVRLPVPLGLRTGVPLAVMAPDDCLRPEGIRSGFVCFAARGAELLEGDTVFAERVDGAAGLRRYEGRSPTGLRLCRFADDGSPMPETMAEDRIAFLSPVAFIRRKW